MPEANKSQRRRLSRRARNALLTAHIMVSVGLLGDSAGFLAVAIRAAKAADAGTMVEMVKVLGMFAFVFGIPLSFASLLTGVALGLGTTWGVFRYPWATTKLRRIVSVMFVGALAIGPALNAAIQHGASTTPRLIAAASYDVLALGVATGQSVFKPGRPFRSET